MEKIETKIMDRLSIQDPKAIEIKRNNLRRSTQLQCDVGGLIVMKAKP